jgi:hypothetical protein
LRPCGLMDKALPSGGRDCGFESRLGLVSTLFSGPDPLAVICGLWCSGAKVLAAPATRGGGGKKGGDARIELATSCTLSKNHTTRPITHIRTRLLGNESNSAFSGVHGCRVHSFSSGPSSKKNMPPTPRRPRLRKKGSVPPAGIEPATNRLKVERST